MAKKKQANQSPKPIECALTLPNGHYMENPGPYGHGCGFDVVDGEIHLSSATFSPMEKALEKIDQIEELMGIHNRWYSREMAGIRRAKAQWWDDIKKKLSIPADVDITVSYSGVIKAVCKKEGGS